MGLIQKSSSLGKSLSLWFILLSLVPLSLVSWISYQQANESLNDAAKKTLEESASLSALFIKGWFDYRVMDITLQGKNAANSALLASLIEGLDKSKLSAKDYTNSFDWANRTHNNDNQLAEHQFVYDYIDNIMLTDTKGNILYSLTDKHDLGRNLFHPSLSNTRFSKSAQKTLATGETIFSDLETHNTSSHINGFLNTPILSSDGNKLGILTFQFQISRLINVLKPITHKNTSITHYLIGEDGLLRTPVDGDEGEILNRSINTAQFSLWVNEKSKKHTENSDENQAAFNYIGPNNIPVIGTHSMLELPGITWAVFSEIDEKEALSPARWFGIITLITVLVTTMLVILISTFQVRRIVSPIIALLKATEKVANGKIHQRVNIQSTNEIGKLASSFNNMLEVRQKHEEELEEATLKMKLANTELNSQKHALDQHAIVAITNLSGDIIFVNNKLCEITGYKEEEILNKNHRILNSGYHKPEFFKQMFDTIMSGKTWHGEICNKAKDGHLYWVDTTITPLLNSKGVPERYIAIRTDITASKIAEEKAEAATQQKSEFLANMSHEIRTPMNGIIGMTGLLLDTELNPLQIEFAKNTMKSAESLLTIINDILDFSKIEAGKLDLEEIPFSLQTLAEDVSKLMAIKCQEKNLEMLLRYQQGTPSFFLGDPGRVRQILLNLLSNAIKFTDKGNILLSIEELKTDDNTSTLLCSIKDTGIGIETKHLNRIFNKFDQEDGSTTRKYGGTGLGLAICKQLCALMQGDINVKSEKGVGTNFYFTIKLPIAKKSPSGIKKINEINLTNLNILIIDDLEIARSIIAEQLFEFKTTIHTASSGKEGIKIIKTAIENNNPIDIVITDYNMKNINGKKLAEIIKSQNLLSNGALVFVTATPRKESNEQLKDMGFDGYITKPTRPSELSKIISIIWKSKIDKKIIPLVTRHMLQKKKDKKEKVSFKNTHVLLAEDNPINKLVATQYLEQYGCTITPAGNGLEAIIQLRENTFDLILMDCQMPEMDGFEATKEIRRIEKDEGLKRTPIIAFTANAMQGDKDACIQAGMDDYLSKPISVNALEDILCKWLENKKSVVQSIVNNKNRQISKEDLNIFNIEPFEALQALFKKDFPSAVKQYTTSTNDNIFSIESALKIEDVRTLERMAHSIKGSSAQFGATKLNEIAEKMEVYAEKGDIEEIISLLPEMKIAQVEIESLMLEKIKTSVN